MSTLRLATGLSLPLDAATQTLLIVGKRGSGKSSTATRFAEQLITARVPVAVLDPVDVWYGLKAGADGRDVGGLEVYVFGGRHADLPLEPTAGALMADVLVDDRINAIMVIRQFSNREKAQFVSAFADRLFQRNQDALHLICEEAHEVMPQQPFKGEEEMLGRMQRLNKLGRSSGIGMSSVTQRPASLNKNVTTQAEILIAHRLLGPQDVKAIEEWIKHHRVEALKQQVLSTLGELKTGDAWVWAPDFPEEHPIGLKRVHMFMPETFDSRRTPKPGEQRREPRQLAPVDLEKLEARMTATIERAKQTDPKELQREVGRLRSELAKKPAAVAPAMVKERRIEVPILKDSHLQRFERAVGVWVKGVDQLGGITTSVGGMVRELQGTLAKVRANGAGPPLSLGRVSPAEMPAPRPVLAHRPPRPDGDVKLGLAQRKILTVLAQYPQGRTVTQLALLTGYAAGGGAFRNPMSALRTLQFIEGAGQIRLTAQGEAALGEWEPLPEPGAALLDYWMRRLGHAEREILRVLAAAYPRSLTVQDVARQTRSSKGDAYEPEGGAFRNPMSRLRTLELIEGRGEVRLSNVLVERVPA